MRKILASAGAAVAIMSVEAAEASIDITLLQVGPDLVVSFDGALNTSGLPTSLASTNYSTFRAKITADMTAAISFGAGSRDYYSSAFSASLPQFALFDIVNSNMPSTGDVFAIWNGASLSVPQGHIFGTLSGSMTIAGQSYASLGLIDGVYTSGTLPSGDFVRVTIDHTLVESGPSPAPAPATLSLLAAGLAALGIRAARKR